MRFTKAAEYRLQLARQKRCGSDSCPVSESGTKYFEEAHGDYYLKEFAERMAAKPGHIVDLGCGSARLRNLVLPIGCTYQAVDSVAMKETRGKSWFTCEFMSHTKLQSACADYIVAARSLICGCHILDATKEMYRLLKPGGSAFVHEQPSSFNIGDINNIPYWMDNAGLTWLPESFGDDWGMFQFYKPQEA